MAYQLHQGFGWLIWLVVVAWAVVAVAYFQVNLHVWLRFWLPVAIFAPLMPFAVSRLPTYRRAQEAWMKIQSEFPSIVVEMQPTK